MIVDEKKTDDDIKVEESIINEMMEIVVKRDSLIAVLEEDRLRCLSHKYKRTLTGTTSFYYDTFLYFACLLLLLSYLIYLYFN